MRMGSRRRQIHVLTPGDHFSPGTGSAVASVVHGLASAAQEQPSVVVAQGTYPDRYFSADVLEYVLVESPHGAPTLVRALDVAFGRLALPRPWARRVWRQTVANQDGWEAAFIIGHNAPQLVPLIHGQHVPVLYAHNDVLRRYSVRESQRALSPAYRIVAVSEFLATRLTENLTPNLRDRVRVVHNGVDATHFDVPRKAAGDSLRVGFVGRVIPDKGAHVLLAALAKIGRSDMSVKVIGSAGFSASGSLTKYENELRRMAADIAGDIEFLPFQTRPELPHVMADLDVVVVPSVWPEPFALVVLEAMAAGAAVVASDIGGIPEAAGDDAVLFPPGDADALAEVLVGLQESPTLLKAIAVAGKRRATKMTWARSADLLEAVLH